MKLVFDDLALADSRKITIGFGIKQPHVSALRRDRAANFSVGRLFEFLTVLGQEVRITVKPTRKRMGEMEVVVS